MRKARRTFRNPHLSISLLGVVCDAECGRLVQAGHKPVDITLISAEGETTTELRGWWKDNNGKHDLVLQGDWYQGTASIWMPDTNQGIGKILLQPVNLDSNWDKEEYIVTVAPGVDVQVFAGIVIAFEAVLSKELK